MVSKRFFIFAYWHDPRWKKFVGATVKIRDLAVNLALEKHEVVLFLPRYGFEAFNSPVRLVEVPFIDLPVIRWVSFNLCLLAIAGWQMLVRRPDAVYVRRMASIVPGILAKLYRVRFFYEINDDPFRREIQEGSRVVFEMRKRLAEWIDILNIRWADHVFVITAELLDKLLFRIEGLCRSKCSVLPSGSDTQRFVPLNRGECLKALGLDPEAKYVGFVGSLLRHQGIDTLLDAARAIIVEERNTRFIIIGEGPMKAEWRAKAVSYDIDPWFRFAGQIDYDDLPLWIGAFDIAVAPYAKTAGLRSPVKIFDYLACGRAVVASAIDGTTDVFKRSGAVVFVPPGDPESLSRAILALIRDIESADRMGGTGRAFVKRHFDRRTLSKEIMKAVTSNPASDYPSGSDRA